MSRLFLDSNVLIKGFVVPWSFDRVVLKYCAARLHQMVYAEAVKIEVERFLLIYAERHQAEWLLDDYDKLIKRAQPERIDYPAESEIIAARNANPTRGRCACSSVGDAGSARLVTHEQP